jgi:S1-C subfamily serine protease
MKKLLPAILVSAAIATTWVCLNPGSVSRGEKESPASKQPTASRLCRVPPRRPEELPGFEKAVRAVYEHALPSIGLMFVGPKQKRSGTAVIISREGHVLTHAHHGQEPGTLVEMVFGDGRKASGRLLGVHQHFDLSLVKLDGKGPWPALPLGTAASLKPGDPCLAVGYPVGHMTFFGKRDEKGRPPLLRLGRVLGLHEHFVMSSCSIFGGDSGGPLLNLQGEAIGTCNLAGKVVEARLVKVAGYINVDVFQKIRQQLLEEKVFTEDTLLKTFARTGPFENTKGLDALATPAHRSVVTIFAREKPVALGLVIAADGWVVTKASVLDGPLVCQLADDRKLEASLKGKSETNDLALLQVPVNDLPVASWHDGPVPPVARVVASIGPKSTPLSFGAVCSKVEAIPAVKGALGSGFPEVFVHDGLLNSEQCGGPLVDATGKVVAINIATSVFDDTCTYAIPAAVVRKTVEELRKERGGK